MPETLLCASMLLPSVHADWSWKTFFASGLFEWNAATFAIVKSPLLRGLRGGDEATRTGAGVIPPRGYA